MQEHKIFHNEDFNENITNYLDTNDKIKFFGLLIELGSEVPKNILNQLIEENQEEIRTLKQKIDEKNRDEKYQGFFRLIDLQKAGYVLFFFNLALVRLLDRYLKRPEENTDNNYSIIFWPLIFACLFFIYSLDPLKDLIERYGDCQSHLSAIKNATEDLEAKENQSKTLEKIKRSMHKS